MISPPITSKPNPTLPAPAREITAGLTPSDLGPTHVPTLEEMAYLLFSLELRVSALEAAECREPTAKGNIGNG